MINTFFNGHNHTVYSNIRLVDCINRPDVLIDKAIEYGLSGIAITDHESLGAHIKVNKIAKAYRETHPDFTIALGNEIYLTETRERGQKYYEEGRVHFLEKIGNSYFAIVEGTESYVVIINQVDDSHIRFWCSCKYNTFCKHLYAVLLAIRNKKFNNFLRYEYEVDI